MFPKTRLRRLRSNEAVRKIFSSGLPSPGKFIQPVFVIEGENAKIAIPSMPGQFQVGTKQLLRIAEDAVCCKIGGLMLFGAPGEKKKDSDRRAAWN
nr:hypothetical protein [Victivallales bacterium]